MSDNKNYFLWPGMLLFRGCQFFVESLVLKVSRSFDIASKAQTMIGGTFTILLPVFSSLARSCSSSSFLVSSAFIICLLENRSRLVENYFQFLSHNSV